MVLKRWSIDFTALKKGLLNKMSSVVIEGYESSLNLKFKFIMSSLSEASFQIQMVIASRTIA